jgi:hypothetical protein
MRLHKALEKNMFDILAIIGAFPFVMVAVALLFTPRRIAAATASFMAIRNNDRDLIIKLNGQVFKVPEEPSALKEIAGLLPKGKSDE